MIKIFLIILLINSCSQNSCEFGINELEKSLNVMYLKKIFEHGDKELNIQLIDKLSFSLPSELSIKDQKIKLYTEKRNIPSINILAIKTTIDSLVKVNFSVFKSARRYKGEIVFKCKDDKLIYHNIHYYSSID